MAGGTWLVQNKVRPGAYLNFQSVPRPLMPIGDRGIAIIPVELDWGNETELIEVYSDEFLNGISLHKIGITASDDTAISIPINLIMQGAYKALIYRTNRIGIKATKTLGNLTATAKYSGIAGNKIHVAIVETPLSEMVEVKTYFDAVLKDTQRAMVVADLKNNNFVDFSGTGDLAEFAGELLVGGTNGIVNESSWLTSFLSVAEKAKWQTMAFLSAIETSKNIVTEFIATQRNKGHYVQAVLNNYSADHEGIINSTSGAVMNNVIINPNIFVAWVAGQSAGASVVTSLTANKVIGATSITNEKTNDEIIQALLNGEFILSTTQENKVKVEQDINSFTSFIPTKGREFRKNRIIRLLDEIGTSVRLVWENSYMGKVNNNESGRSLFRGDIVQYLFSLQTIGAIQEFGGAIDIKVTQGDELDAVLADVRIKPVDSMEFLYMTVRLDR